VSPRPWGGSVDPGIASFDGEILSSAEPWAGVQSSVAVRMQSPGLVGPCDWTGWQTEQVRWGGGFN
jgi:hypothetical protein